jgi:uncharacterized protein
MIIDEQKSVIAFLSRPETYGRVDRVEILETHISIVFLAGDRAFKLKRAVRLPYVDFSTPDFRRLACEEEVRRNGPTAPGLYLGVRRIMRAMNGEIGFDGDGETIDAVVEMVRFDQSCLLDRMAESGDLNSSLMVEVAGMIADFHESAPVVRTKSGALNMASVLDINEAGFASSHVFDAGELRGHHALFRQALSRHQVVLDRRARNGKIRLCHGDLHLRNICMFNGKPTLFDCIEFNDAIATVDVLYDLSFLLMDLWHRGEPDLANLVMNRYLDLTDEEDGFALLPFFMAVRASVRAHVTATQIDESAHHFDKLVALAQSYFTLATDLLSISPPKLIAVGGLSGSGKTTVAEALAPRVGPPPGARIVESDRVRKAMFGVPPETRLAPNAYVSEVSMAVYKKMAEKSRNTLLRSGSVVADAVFDKPGNRKLIANVARDARAHFSGIWLDVAPKTLRNRLASRAPGCSDATLDVLENQLARLIGRTDWMHIDADRPVDIIVEEILQRTCENSANHAEKSLTHINAAQSPTS